MVYVSSKKNLADRKNNKIKAKRKIARSVSEACVYIRSSFNNTLITVTDVNGKVLCTSSAGACGFSGSKKRSNLAGMVAAKTAVKHAIDVYGVEHINIIRNGIGKSSDLATIAAGQAGAKVGSISDVTKIAHGGVRPRKRKRI